jgi:hypothetical protein
MNTKGHVFQWLQEFKYLVENQTRKKIEVLRYDNGVSIPLMSLVIIVLGRELIEK